MNQHYSPEEKVKILEEGEKAGVSVAEVCRRCQISTTTYFTWRKEAREAMKAHFKNGKRSSLNARKEEKEKQKIQGEIRRLRAVIAEITAVTPLGKKLSACFMN